jgi:hypothetical protein
MLNLLSFEPTRDVRMPLRHMIARRWPAGPFAGGLCSTLAAAILVTVLSGAGSALAQSPSDRVIEAFTCKDVMREPNTSREVAIAFLHGYLLGKSGGSKFNVEMLERQTDAFIEQCLDNPQDKAVDVMTKLRG